MTDYLNYFFNPRHLWSLRPPVMHTQAALILAVGFGALVIAGLVFRALANKSHDGLLIKGYRKLVHFCLTMGIIGFVYLFAAFEGAVLLSARFWLLIWAIAALVWLWFVLRYFWKQVPERRRELSQKREFAKYLP